MVIHVLIYFCSVHCEKCVNLPTAHRGQKPFLNDSLEQFSLKKDFFIKFQDLKQRRKFKLRNSDNTCILKLFKSCSEFFSFLNCLTIILTAGLLFSGRILFCNREQQILSLVFKSLKIFDSVYSEFSYYETIIIWQSTVLIYQYINLNSL